jgi:hypothetical protein
MSDGTVQDLRSTDSGASAVAALMPRLRHDLAQLVEIPSISAPSYPEHTREHRDTTVPMPASFS